MGSKNPERCAPTLADDLPLAVLVERFADWRLAVYCAGCMQMKRFDPRDLRARKKPPITIGEFRTRLRCEKCEGGTVMLVKPVLKARRER
jgi:hypothetical protein